TAATGIITTIAGNGGFGDSGDGGPATSAGLWGPLDIAVDRGGDIYVVGLSRVRRVTAATGVISTVAGNGIGAFSGDGGPATDAQLMDPNGIAVDLAGNIYIADSSGRVRKVSAATGIISTIAGNGTFGSSGDGGPATSATVRCIPGGLAVDGGGNVYIADYSARVRKVSAATGIISTIAGNGSPGYSGDGGPATDAQLSVGGGLAVSESGDVFLAEAGNRRVRKVAVATGIVSTIAGDGTVGPSGDGGLATSAQLVEPYGVNVDNAGNVYFSDRNRVRKVALTGIISTFAGNGTVNYSGDGGPATSGGLSSPARVAADAAGNVYISDEGRVRFVGAAVPPVPHDFSGDGCADLVALDVVGTARAYDGNCAGGFRAGTGGALPGDYHPATDVLRGDFSGDGCADNLLLLTNGALYLLAGDCHGGYQPGQPLTIGTGWDAFRAVLSPGDWDGDGCADLLGILPDGDMRLYAGSCASGFKPGTGATIGTDWGAFRAVLSPGDWDGDGCADLLGILSDGDMRLYAGTCAGPFLAGTGLQIGTDWAAFSNVIAPGDWDGDSNPDVLAILPGGDLRLYAGGGSGAFKAGTGARIGIDWAGFRLVR
ncbi:MAG: FG-GAP-like repeat-containing protein, partial [Acidimicrobiales bacterium]